MTIFETPRLLVRRFNESDLEFFIQMNADEDFMRYIRPVRTREQSTETFTSLLKNYETEFPLGRWLCVEKESYQPIGTAVFIPLQNSDEIQVGYGFMKPYWGQGFGKELLQGLMQYVSSTDQVFVVAVTEKDNIASQKVLLANDFSFEGIHVSEEKELLKYRYDFKNSD